MTRRVGKFGQATEGNPAEREGEFVEMQVGRTGIPDRLSSWVAKMSGVRSAELERKSELREGGRGSRALRTEF